MAKERDTALKSLLEMMETIACKEPPVLGEAIPWKQVEGQFLRVSWCSFLASIQDGTIEPAPMGSYAALGVESPSLTGEAFIVVSNEVDFGLSGSCTDRDSWQMMKRFCWFTLLRSRRD